MESLSSPGTIETFMSKNGIDDDETSWVNLMEGWTFEAKLMKVRRSSSEDVETPKQSSIYLFLLTKRLCLETFILKIFNNGL